MDISSPLTGSAKAFLQAAEQAPMKLPVWRRHRDLLDILRIASIERFLDPEARTDYANWNDTWHRTTGQIVEWAHQAPSGGQSTGERYAGEELRRAASYKGTTRGVGRSRPGDQVWIHHSRPRALGDESHGLGEQCCTSTLPDRPPRVARTRPGWSWCRCLWCTPAASRS